MQEWSRARLEYRPIKRPRGRLRTRSGCRPDTPTEGPNKHQIREPTKKVPKPGPIKNPTGKQGCGVGTFFRIPTPTPTPAVLKNRLQ